MKQLGCFDFDIRFSRIDKTGGFTGATGEYCGLGDLAIHSRKSSEQTP